MRVPLPASTPSAAGVDAAGLLRFVDALEQSPTQEPHGLMILRGGAVIARGWWAPYSADRPQLVYSLSKSFTAAAAGLLVDDGRLDLDAPVVAFFPEFEADITDARSRRIRVRDVAAMASGHLHDLVLEAESRDPAEPVRGFLLHPPEREPGTIFAYNQPATYTLAAIVQRVSGRTLVDLLRERVHDPIGAEDDLSWLQDPSGRDLGYSGAYATTETVARLGQLLLRRGDWAGRRVLSDEWVRLATSPQIPTPTGDPDWSAGYGFQHWMSRYGYRGDGAYGQFCLVLPEVDAVVAMQGRTEDMQGTLDAVWRHVLPAFAGPGSEAADAALAERLAAARLPPLRVDGVPVDAAPWDGARFVSEGSSLRAEVRRTPHRWHLAVVVDEVDIRLDFDPDGGWCVDDSAPDIAVSGGFETTERLRLDLAFLDLPHRFQLTLERPVAGAVVGTATAAWATTPLHDFRVLRAHAVARSG